jgi:hypothetical protein
MSHISFLVLLQHGVCNVCGNICGRGCAVCCEDWRGSAEFAISLVGFGKKGTEDALGEARYEDCCMAEDLISHKISWVLGELNNVAKLSFPHAFPLL